MVTVVGRKGCGKTTLVREIVREHARVVILDWCHEYGAEVGAQVKDGLRACALALVAASRERRFRLSLRVDELAGDPREQFLELLTIVWQMPGVLLVVDEASAYQSPSWMPPELARFPRIGRHRGISQLYVAQRPSMLHRDVTSQSDLLVSFQQHEERDVRYLVNLLGPAGERVRQLGLFEIVAGGPGMDRAPLAVLARLGQPKKSVAPSARPR